jgi:hypothetical protein
MFEVLAMQGPLKALGRLNYRRVVLFVKIPLFAATAVRLQRIVAVFPVK